MMTDKALRYNEGKPQWSLVDFDSLEPMVRVLEFGAKKYTKKLISFQKLVSLIQLGQELESVQIVLKKNTLLLNDSVVHVIENGHVQYDHVYPVVKKGNGDQSLIVDRASKEYDYKTTQINGVINKSIGENIPVDQNQNKEKESVMQRDETIQSMYKKGNDLHFLGGLDSTVSLKIFIGVSHQEVVQYADLLKDYISIITIRHDSTEVYFVVNATNEYDCLMTLYRKFQMLGIIGSEISEDNIVDIISGVDNWKKPMDRKKILDSLMRHLVRINAGEEIDPESGLPHIGHLLCNALFYSYHARNSTEHPDTSGQL